MNINLAILLMAAFTFNGIRAMEDVPQLAISTKPVKQKVKRRRSISKERWAVCNFIESNGWHCPQCNGFYVSFRDPVTGKPHTSNIEKHVNGSCKFSQDTQLKQNYDNALPAPLKKRKVGASSPFYPIIGRRYFEKIVTNKSERYHCRNCRGEAFKRNGEIDADCSNHKKPSAVRSSEIPALSHDAREIYINEATENMKNKRTKIIGDKFVI